MTVLLMFVVALVLVRVTAELGRTSGLVDVPDGRKRHTGRVPLTGGIAIWALVLISPYLFDTSPLPLAALAIGSAVFLTGIIDWRDVNDKVSWGVVWIGPLPNRDDDACEHAGLFRGLAGIGWHALRQLAPDRLPALGILGGLE